MCVGIYIATHRPLDPPATGRNGLGIEPAPFVPPPLRARRHVYAVGQKDGDGPGLTCACFLLEHVDWGEANPVLTHDEGYARAEDCPFAALAALLETALARDGLADLLSADLEGPALEADEAPYPQRVLMPRLVVPGGLLFAHPNARFPRCHYVVVPDQKPLREGPPAR